MADDTSNQLELLEGNRRRLAVLLRQLTNQGANHTPPGVFIDIEQARTAIAHLKATLREAGVTVDNQVGDTPLPGEGSLPSSSYPAFQVPYPPNPLFVGRGAELAELAKRFAPDAPVILTS